MHLCIVPSNLNGARPLTKGEKAALKLAEALQERADLNRKIENLRSRIGNSLLVQEGEEPGEDPHELLKNLEEALSRLAYLMAAINLTNCRTKVDGMTLTEMIAKKDALLLKVSAYKDMVYTAGQTAARARGTEIKVKAAIRPADLQREADRAAMEARKLDNLLQETNWKTKLMEK